MAIVGHFRHFGFSNNIKDIGNGALNFTAIFITRPHGLEVHHVQLQQLKYVPLSLSKIASVYFFDRLTSHGNKIVPEVIFAIMRSQANERK